MLNDEISKWVSNKNTVRQYVSQINSAGNIEDLKKLDDGRMVELLNSKLGGEGNPYNRRFAFKFLLKMLGREQLYFQLKKVAQPPRRLVRKTLSFDKIKKVVGRIDDPALRLIVLLQYETACRISALLVAKRSAVSDDCSEIIVFEPKTKERGSYPLTEYTRTELTNYMKSGNAAENDRLFPLDYYKNIWYKLKKYGISSHWMRTSRLVHLFKAGYNIVDVANFAMHRNIESTRRYLKESGEEIRKIAEKEKPEW